MWSAVLSCCPLPLLSCHVVCDMNKMLSTLIQENLQLGCICCLVRLFIVLSCLLSCCPLSCHVVCDMNEMLFTLIQENLQLEVSLLSWHVVCCLEMLSCVVCCLVMFFVVMLLVT